MSIAAREALATMADVTMERSLSATIESSVAAAAGTLIWLIPLPPHHWFQEQEPSVQHPDADEVHTITGDDDVVASLLDEFIPRDSDLDERILECPMIHRVLLLAMASLQQEAIIVDTQIIIQQLELQAEDAYRDGGFGAVPAAAAAVASLRKRTFFHAAGGGGDGSAGRQSCCSICLDDFEDGEEMSVMPCTGAHEFHTSCVAEWLGRYSNMCPLDLPPRAAHRRRG